MPHILGDGMTLLNLIKLFICGINGLPMEAMAIEAPSMIGAIAPDHWWQWPGKIMRSRQHKVAERKLLASVHVQQLPRRPQPFHSTTGLSHGRLPVPVAQLRQACPQAGSDAEHPGDRRHRPDLPGAVARRPQSRCRDPHLGRSAALLPQIGRS